MTFQELLAIFNKKITEFYINWPIIGQTIRLENVMAVGIIYLKENNMTIFRVFAFTLNESSSLLSRGLLTSSLI